MITLAVVAILAALATPSFTGVINSNRLTGQANELVAGIQMARSEAVRRNRRITLCRSTDGATCANAVGKWNAWLVAVPGTNPLEIIQRGTLKAPLELTAGVKSVDFRPDGLARDATTGGLLVTAFTVCLPTTRPAENIRQVAKVKNSSVRDLTVCILDRPRHQQLMADVREAGARIRLISDGDVAGAISACRPNSGTDMLVGIGGTPEGIIAAAAIRCVGGAVQATLAPPDDAERQKALDRGHDLDRVLTTEDLVSGENVFFCATGVTDGDLLKGVQYYGGGCTTQSIVMRSKSGTVRMIEAYHRLSKLNEYSAVDFTGDKTAAYPLP